MMWDMKQKKHTSKGFNILTSHSVWAPSIYKKIEFKKWDMHLRTRTKQKSIGVKGKIEIEIWVIRIVKVMRNEKRKLSFELGSNQTCPNLPLLCDKIPKKSFVMKICYHTFELSIYYNLSVVIFKIEVIV